MLRETRNALLQKFALPVEVEPERQQQQRQEQEVPSPMIPRSLRRKASIFRPRAHASDSIAHDEDATEFNSSISSSNASPHSKKNFFDMVEAYEKRGGLFLQD